MRLTTLLVCLAAGGNAIAEDVPNCFAKVAQTESFAPLSKKMALINADKPSVEMLTNTAKPNKAEQKLIGRWMAALEDCIKDNPSYDFSGLPPDAASLMQSQQVELFTTTAALYAGKLTYAEYATDRAKTTTEFLSRLRAIIEEVEGKKAAAYQADRLIEQRERIVAQQAEQHRQRMQQQAEQAQQAAEAARQQAILQMMANQPRPRPLQLYQMPIQKSTNCTSNVIGSTLHTNCQ